MWPYMCSMKDEEKRKKREAEERAIAEAKERQRQKEEQEKIAQLTKVEVTKLNKANNVNERLNLIMGYMVKTDFLINKRLDKIESKLSSIRSEVDSIDRDIAKIMYHYNI